MDDNDYSIGDVLRPIRGGKGYSQVYKVDILSEERQSLYGTDKLYHIYTDFGNTLILTSSTLSSTFTVLHNEDVISRAYRLSVEGED